MYLLRLAGLVLVAYLAFGLTVGLMFFVPGTPHRRALEQMWVLESYRTSPEASGAGAAFDEFLRLGEQTRLVDATVVSAAAGVAVALVARASSPLVLRDIAIVVLGFLIGQMWRQGPRMTGVVLLAIAVFGAVIWVAEWLRRSSSQGAA
jgi:hypothetical protein